VAGAEFFLELLGFDAAVADCTAVITGEAGGARAECGERR
jgi:hypothetical protein